METAIDSTKNYDLIDIISETFSEKQPKNSGTLQFEKFFNRHQEHLTEVINKDLQKTEGIFSTCIELNLMELFQMLVTKIPLRSFHNNSENVQSFDEDQLLLMALLQCARGKTNWLEKRLRAGADANTCFFGLGTLLTTAIRLKQKDAVAILISYGASLFSSPKIGILASLQCYQKPIIVLQTLCGRHDGTEKQNFLEITQVAETTVFDSRWTIQKHKNCRADFKQLVNLLLLIFLKDGSKLNVLPYELLLDILEQLFILFQEFRFGNVNVPKSPVLLSQLQVTGVQRLKLIEFLNIRRNAEADSAIFMNVPYMTHGKGQDGLNRTKEANNKQLLSPLCSTCRIYCSEELKMDLFTKGIYKRIWCLCDSTERTILESLESFQEIIDFVGSLQT